MIREMEKTEIKKKIKQKNRMLDAYEDRIEEMEEEQTACAEELNFLLMELDELEKGESL